MRRLAAAGAFACLLGSDVSAAPTGDLGPLPDARLTGFVGDAPADTLKGLRGRAVVLFFFSTSSAECVGQVGRLNKWHEELGPKGLVVIGLSPDARGPVAEWKGRNSALFAVAPDADGKIAASIGIGPFPWGILITPVGRLAWEGIPTLMPEELVTKAIEEGIGRFAYEFPAAFKPIEARVRARDLGGAWTALGKLPATADAAFVEKLKADIAGWATDWRAKAEAEAEGGDYPYATELLTELAAQVKGTPEAEACTKLLDEWKADPKVKAEVKAGGQFAAALGMERKANFPAAFQAYQKIAKSHAGTKVGERATAAASRIEQNGLLKVRPGCPDCTAKRAPCDKHK